MDLTPSQDSIICLFTYALALPLVSALALILLTRRVLFKAAGPVATGVMVLSFGCAVAAMLKWFGLPEAERHAFTKVIHWIPTPGNSAGWLDLGIMVDGL